MPTRARKKPAKAAQSPAMERRIVVYLPTIEAKRALQKAAAEHEAKDPSNRGGRDAGQSRLAGELLVTWLKQHGYLPKE